MKYFQSDISWSPRLLVSLYLIVTVSILAVRAESHGGRDIQFNELVFTQQWGFSACLQYKEEAGQHVKCNHERSPSIWSVHGIWPTQIGTEGPNFCSKVKFDESLLTTIMEELNLYWYTIKGDTDPSSFWAHEWIKHGSCAKELPELGSELQYFQHGLILRNKFDIYSILKDRGIIPKVNEGYLFSEISSAIAKTLNVTPHIQCLQVKENRESVYYLLTVELCLDTTLKPIDCSPRHSLLRGSLQCPNNQPILYHDNFAKLKTEL